MKQLLLILSLFILVCCTNNKVNFQEQNTVKDKSNSCEIIEITKNGKTHQFIHYRGKGGGISHCPDCIFCDTTLQNPEGNPDDVINK